MQTLCLFVKLCCNLSRISALCTHDKRESFLKSNRVFNHPFVPNSSHFLHLTDVPYESKVALAYLKPCGLSVYTWCQIATNYACCKLNNHANTVIFLSLENESAVFSSLSVKLKKIMLGPHFRADLPMILISSTKGVFLFYPVLEWALFQKVEFYELNLT